MAMPRQIYRDAINAFYGGKSSDVRFQKLEQAFISSGFDIYTNPKKLTPLRTMSADEDLTFNIVNFLYENSTFYGLGVKVGGAVSKLYYKITDPISGAWTAVTNGESASGARGTVFFKAFHNYLYWAAAGSNRLLAHGDITGSPTLTETAYSITNLPSAQGIVTSDDLLLVPCRNLLIKKDGAGSGPTDTWSVALTLPSDVSMTDLVEIDANTVAIACQTNSGEGSSRVYLWDKVATDIADYIEWGAGVLKILDIIESELIGVSSVGGVLRGKLVVRSWSGGKARVRFEIQSDDSTLTLYGNHTKLKIANTLSFGLKIKLDGTTYFQMASVGRKTDEFPLAFSLANLIDNNTAITSIDGAGKYNDYLFFAHNADGSVNRTASTNLFAATATYISQKITGERQALDMVRRDKKLTMAGIICESLPADTTLVLSVRMDGGSWTTVRTYTTSGGYGFEAGALADGTEFVKGKEFQFKLTALGAAADAQGLPTTIIYAYEDLGAEIDEE